LSEEFLCRLYDQTGRQIRLAPGRKRDDEVDGPNGKTGNFIFLRIPAFRKTEERDEAEEKKNASPNFPVLSLFTL